MVGVVQLSTQHLVSAAHADDHAALARVADDGGIQAAVAQVNQILDGVFRAGKDNQVGIFDLLRGLGIAHLHAGLKRQGLEICEVGDVLQLHHGNVQITLTHHAAETFGYAVLILQPHVHPRHNA